MSDPFDLERFVAAQAPVFETALAELESGAKRSHWMWFVFPQLAGLGMSPTAQFYGVASLDEARAYLAHPLLGPRLARCTQVVVDSRAASLPALFGSIDALKFISCMTLFQVAGAGAGPFQSALDRWNGGAQDPRTTALLGLSEVRFD